MWIQKILFYMYKFWKVDKPFELHRNLVYFLKCNYMSHQIYSDINSMVLLWYYCFFVSKNLKKFCAAWKNLIFCSYGLKLSMESSCSLRLIKRAILFSVPAWNFWEDLFCFFNVTVAKMYLRNELEDSNIFSENEISCYSFTAVCFRLIY